jgi:multiple sugar transport system substrate-binding protein
MHFMRLTFGKFKGVGSLPGNRGGLSFLFKCLFFCLILSFLFFLAGILFSGCSADDDEGLTFAVGGAPAELEFWVELINDFEKQSGIEVDLLRQPTDTDLRRQNLVMPLRSRQSEPDVFLMDVAWLGQFAASGWLEDLSGYVGENELELDSFFVGVVELADRYEGMLVGLPVYVDGGVLYYRKDLLEEYGFAGPPGSWKELIEQSKLVQEGEREKRGNNSFVGFVWQGAQYEGLVCNWLEFAGSNRGGFVSKNGRIVVDSRANIEATRFMHDLIYKYKISPLNTFTEMKEEEVRTVFQQGNSLFERNWPYAWPLHESEDSNVQGKVGLSVLPSFEGGQSVSTLGGWHAGISQYSDAKDEAWELVKFILSYETQKKLALRLGWNPGRRDVYRDEDVVERYPHFEVLREAFENLRPRPGVAYWTLASEIIQRYVNGVLSGSSDASEALEEAQREIDFLAEKYERD